MSAAVQRVLVVGAGLAGLVAAHRLRAAGHAVTVLEASARAGGKHARESLAGISYEPWPEFAPRASRACAELVAELGLAAKLTRTPLARIGWLRGDHVRTGSTGLYERMRGSPLTPLRLRRLALLHSWLGAEIDPEAPERTTRLDDRSVADFCRVYLGRRALDQFLAPLVATIFGIDTAHASRELLFALLDGRACIGLDQVEGAAALVDALEVGAPGIRYEARVAELESDGGGARLANGERLDADAVVLAVGAGEAMRLLPDKSPAESSASEALHANSSLVLALALREGAALPARAIMIPEREGGELAGVVEVTAVDAHGPRLLLLVARPGLFARHGARPDAEIANFLIESGARAIPGLANGIEAQRLHRFADARPSFRVGHFRALATILEAMRKRPERRIALAGDWLVAPHLEGEIASGLRAAVELRSSLSLRA